MKSEGSSSRGCRIPYQKFSKIMVTRSIVIPTPHIKNTNSSERDAAVVSVLAGSFVEYQHLLTFFICCDIVSIVEAW